MRGSCAARRDAGSEHLGHVGEPAGLHLVEVLLSPARFHLVRSMLPSRHLEEGHRTSRWTRKQATAEPRQDEDRPAHRRGRGAQEPASRLAAQEPLIREKKMYERAKYFIVSEVAHVKASTSERRRSWSSSRSTAAWRSVCDPKPPVEALQPPGITSKAARKSGLRLSGAPDPATIRRAMPRSIRAIRAFASICLAALAFCAASAPRLSPSPRARCRPSCGWSASSCPRPGGLQRIAGAPAAGAAGPRRGPGPSRPGAEGQLAEPRTLERLQTDVDTSRAACRMPRTG